MESNMVAGFLLTILALYCVIPSLAIDYAVGDLEGWKANYNYEAWLKTKTFTTRDTLVFNYGAGHSVAEVSYSDYENCRKTNVISSDSSGSTKITLKTTGTHYFICGIADYCANGMKMAVSVKVPLNTTSPTATTSTTSSSPHSLSPAIAIFCTFLAVFKLILSPLT